MAWRIEIANTDITNYVVKYKVRAEYNRTAATAEVKVRKNITDTITLAPSQSIEIYSNRHGRIFNGIITNIEEEGILKVITASDMLVKALNTNVAENYVNQTVTYIFKDLCDKSGLQYTNDTIQSNSTTIKEFRCANISAFDRMCKLAEILDWQFYYNSFDGYVYFEPLGYRSNSTPLVIGSSGANCGGMPKWSTETSELVNKLILYAQKKEVGTEETFTGDGSTTTYSLTYRPNNVSVWVNGAIQKGGTESTTTNADYYFYPQQKKIVFITAPANGASIDVKYNYYVNVPLIFTNDESINTYGLHEKTMVVADYMEMNDAEELGNKLIVRYSQPFNRLEVGYHGFNQTPTTPYVVGNIVQVIDNVYNQNKTMQINSVEYRYPDITDTFILGDKLMRLTDWQSNTDSRIKRIEEEMGTETDMVRYVVQCNEDFAFKRAQIDILTRNINDSFIWGHPNNAVWKTTKWGDRCSAWTTEYTKTY